MTIVLNRSGTPYSPPVPIGVNPADANLASMQNSTLNVALYKP